MIAMGRNAMPGHSLPVADRTLEKRIREKALAIWESNGRPQGQELRHWAEAEVAVKFEDNAVELNPAVARETQGEEPPLEVPDLADVGDRRPGQRK